jgi:predicted DNA-binding transcriptional regulator YafY
VSKLAQSLDSPAIVSLETLREHYTFASPGAPPVEPALRVDLEQAIVQRHRVRVRYFTASRGAVTERTLDPYHLHNRHGEWYLVAHDHLRHAKRLFHLSRVQSWRVLAGRFERTPDFDPVAWLQSAFALEMGDRTYQVEVRFDGYQARWIRERHWHPSQQPLEELADGGVVLRFQAQGLGAVQRWVQQFGAHAEVLAPDALRKAISAEIAALARLYEARR